MAHMWCETLGDFELHFSLFIKSKSEKIYKLFSARILSFKVSQINNSGSLELSARFQCPEFKVSHYAYDMDHTI